MGFWRLILWFILGEKFEMQSSENINVPEQQSHLVSNQRYKCTTCQKCFTTRHSLMLHDRIHTGFKPYKCTKCNKQFYQGANLRTHMLTHTQIKKFECSECLKRFSQKGHLVKHQQIHVREKLLKSYREFLKKNNIQFGVDEKRNDVKSSDIETEEVEDLSNVSVKQEVEDSEQVKTGSDLSSDIQIKLEKTEEDDEQVLQESGKCIMYLFHFYIGLEMQQSQ